MRTKLTFLSKVLVFISIFLVFLGALFFIKHIYDAFMFYLANIILVFLVGFLFGFVIGKLKK